MKVDVVQRGLLHWLYDALGGSQMDLPRAGNYSAAVYPVSGNQITIPQAAGGGKVKSVRGVWLASASFEWGGYFSAVDSGDATNYYTGGSYVNNPTNTVITLGAGLANGTQGQVYYYASDGVVLTKNAPYNTWPCWVPCYYNRAYNAAPDSDPKIALTAFEAMGWFGDPVQCAIGREIMARLVEYLSFTNAAPVDDFTEGFYDRRGGSFFKAFGGGATVDSMNTVNNALVVVATTVVAGWALWGKGLTTDISLANNFIINFAGQYSQKRYLITIKASDNSYHYAAFPDMSFNFTKYTLPLTGFLKNDKMVYDGDRRFDDPAWAFNGDGDSGGTVDDFYLNVMEGIIPRYFGKRLTWTLGATGTWYQFYCAPGVGVSSTGTADINFYIKGTIAGTVSIMVYDNGDEIYYKDVAVTTAWQRLSIPWAQFVKYPWYQPPTQDNNGVLNHPIKQVVMKVSPPYYAGTFYLADIRYDTPGNVKAYAEIKSYQFDFPKPGTFTGKWDYIYFDVPTTNKAYSNAIRFSYQWNNAALPLGWMGPAYTGYQVPAAFYRRSMPTIAEAQALFLKAGQDEYASRYGVAAGPFMPVYLVNSPENKDYGTLDTWTWNGPDPNTNWAGFQYRALAGLAHYYWLSGSVTAKAMLDNWMTWLNARITDVGPGDGIHHNYETPGVFVKDTGTFTSYASPYFHAMIAEAMIFKYWRDGDAVALTWYRRLLDDLIYNRVNKTGAKTGSWTNGSYTLGFENAQVGSTLGMLINGRQGAAITYPLGASGADITTFTNLYAYFTGNVGSAKPCALSSDDWLPLHAYESFIGQFIADGSVTSEGIATAYSFAVDYAKYSGDHAWLNKLKDFIKAVLGT